MTSPLVLILDDDASVATVLREALEDEGYRVVHAATLAELAPGMAHGPDVVISDVLLPDGNALDGLSALQDAHTDVPVIVMSAHKTLTTAMRASAEGAFDYIPKPFDLDAVLACVDRALRASQPPLEDAPLAQPGDVLVGRSSAMQRLYRDMARVAQTDLTVLIYGESGTGKELVARALHQHGARSHKPFVSVNMAAIPRELIESELFGHEKGAFTGADRSFEGRFAEADGGTLFLDEIGDMPLEAQTRLLRVLQDGEYRSLGSSRLRRTNVQIFAASNKRLDQQVEEGRFREDLYFRLNVIPLAIPPLRDRMDDLDALSAHFLDQARIRGLERKSLSEDALALMRRHAWPGNVRELENLILRLCVLASDDVISARDVAAVMHAQPSAEQQKKRDEGLSVMIADHLDAYFAAVGSHTGTLDLHARLVRELERPLIKKVLEVTGGNQIKASEILGLNRNTLRQRIRDLDIEIVKSPGKRQ